MPPRPLPYGWVIVGTGMLITCIGLGAMFSLSIFLKPISDAMGWSRTAISTVALLNFLAMGIGSFAWGALSDRIGTRIVVLGGGVVLGAGLVLASRATTLMQFQLLFGVVVGLAAGSFYTPLTATTTRWFTRHRSLAVALVSSGIGFGSLIVGPLASWITTNYDWRTAMLVLGDLAWLIIIPAAFLVRNPPAPLASAGPAPGTSEPAPAITARQAFRSPQLAAIALTHFACCAAHSGPIFHMVTHAIDRGVPALAAATVLGAAGLAALSGRVACGILADRFGVKRTLLTGLALQAVVVLLYLFPRELASFYGLALVFGFAYGGVMPLYAILVREFFGERLMGTVYGAVAFVSALGMAVGPWAGGWFYDTFGSYFWLYTASSAIGVGAVAIGLTCRAPRDVPRALPVLVSN